MKFKETVPLREPVLAVWDSAVEGLVRTKLVDVRVVVVLTDRVVLILVSGLRDGDVMTVVLVATLDVECRWLVALMPSDFDDDVLWWWWW